jgi:hypothetical protein
MIFRGKNKDLLQAGKFKWHLVSKDAGRPLFQAKKAEKGENAYLRPQNIRDEA